ncbi:MAG: hypothetical protein CVU50_06885 [Candidatus Cloacimonetes bacterium HGW-Cloacimonetes-3]|jgi:hypothetical protein|nr:MAG: hypothetical protein CVU50_06885 [Candidatus Cloacimonetes bacterium HGW-Cloacimonetes-3]
MKHLLGVLLLIALCSGLGAVNYRVAVGLDAAGEMIGFNEALIVGMQNYTAPTVSVQVENRQYAVTYGIGVDYQFPRVNKELPGSWTSNLREQTYIPLYGILLYSFPTTTKISPELIVQFGYSFPKLEFSNLDEDERYSVEGGLFSGVGFGLNYQDFTLNMLYRVNGFTMRYDELHNNIWEKGEDYKYQTRQCNISLGYRFGK